jgi:hypothetical protein
MFRTRSLLCVVACCLVPGLAGGLTVALAGSTGSGVSRSLETADIARLNGLRQDHQRHRLALSKLLRSIAEYRAQIMVRKQKPYAGYDVIMDLNRRHVCRRGAREDEAIVTGRSKSAMLRQLGQLYASNRLYRFDVLGRHWRRVGVAVAPGRYRGFRALYIVEDFIWPC